MFMALQLENSVLYILHCAWCVVGGVIIWVVNDCLCHHVPIMLCCHDGAVCSGQSQ